MGGRPRCDLPTHAAQSRERESTALHDILSSSSSFHLLEAEEQRADAGVALSGPLQRLLGGEPPVLLLIWWWGTGKRTGRAGGGNALCECVCETQKTRTTQGYYII